MVSTQTADDTTVTTPKKPPSKRRIAKSTKEKPPRRPLKRTASDKLQLRMIDYQKRFDVATTRTLDLKKKLDNVVYELQFRAKEEAASTESEIHDADLASEMGVADL
jgi:hypothetical protein